MQIQITDTAKYSLSDIHDYLSKISTKYANKTIQNIYKTISSLQNSPYSGRYISEIPNKFYKEKLYKNYRIIYYISQKENTIYIQYIFSGKLNSNLFFNIHKNSLIKKLNQYLNIS